MDLAKFATLPPENNGAFLKFTPSENIKIVRFLYHDASEIKCRQKLYDPATKKVIWDTPEGKWTMNLKVAVYSSKTEFEIMQWDRSAAFGRDVLLPLFEAAGGEICDMVYKVSCAKAGTLDAKFTFFPLKASDEYAMPDIDGGGEAEEEEVEDEAEDEVEEEEEVAPAPVKKAAAKPAQSATKSTPASKPTATPEKKKRNFWEE